MGIIARIAVQIGCVLLMALGLWYTFGNAIKSMFREEQQYRRLEKTVNAKKPEQKGYIVSHIQKLLTAVHKGDTKESNAYIFIAVTIAIFLFSISIAVKIFSLIISFTIAVTAAAFPYLLLRIRLRNLALGLKLELPQVLEFFQFLVVRAVELVHLAVAQRPAVRCGFPRLLEHLRIVDLDFDD
jgi:Flp pilus assembly protein TadB